MSDENDVKNDLSRRQALKSIALGIGVGASLPILGQKALAEIMNTNINTARRRLLRQARRNFSMRRNWR